MEEFFMTTFFMISDYGFAILKVFIFFILLHAVYPTFKYRYAVIISCIAAPFYIQINDYLLYTMLSVLLYILILFISGCILVRKKFFVIIFGSPFLSWPDNDCFFSDHKRMWTCPCTDHSCNHPSHEWWKKESLETAYRYCCWMFCYDLPDA